MSGALSTIGLVGHQAVGDCTVPDTTQKFTLGSRSHFLDPYYGPGEFVYAKNQNAATGNGRLVYIDETFTAVDVPNTANTGYPIYVQKATMAANTYGWFQRTGLCPIITANSIAAGTAFGIAAAGSAGTLANGKQILNAICRRASTFTITKSGILVNGSKNVIITAGGTDGLFDGLVMTGTGAGASPLISGIDPGGNSLAVSVASTSSATPAATTLTFTFTGYIVALMDGAFVQGQIA